MSDKKIRILKISGREEQERQMLDDIDAIVSDMMANGLSRKQISGGYHTFDELYYLKGRKAHPFRCGMDSPYIIY